MFTQVQYGPHNRSSPEYLLSKPVLLANQYMETFLIASPMGEKDVFQNTVVELPTSLDIEVRVIPPKNTEFEELHPESTEHVYAKLNTQVCMDHSNNTYAVPSRLQTPTVESHKTDCSHPKLPEDQPLLKSTVNDDYSNTQTGGTPSSLTTPSSAENLEISSLTHLHGIP